MSHMGRPGASIPSDTFLSISIQIKKTPLISAENPMIGCRYKGGHFEIANYNEFEYIRGISENLWAPGGGVRVTRRRGNGGKLRENSEIICESHMLLENAIASGDFGDSLRNPLRVPHKKICGVSAVSAKTAGYANAIPQNPTITHFIPPIKQLRGTSEKFHREISVFSLFTTKNLSSISLHPKSFSISYL